MILRTFLRAKIHRATVTAADLDYVGSLTVDSDLLDAAHIAHLEQVDVYNISNGARLTTYALRGRPGSGEVQANGAAAHLVRPGDLVIIVSYAQVDSASIAGHAARVVLVDGHNRVSEVREDPPSFAPKSDRL